MFYTAVIFLLFMAVPSRALTSTELIGFMFGRIRRLGGKGSVFNAT